MAQGGGLRLTIKLAGDGDILARFGVLKKELERQRRTAMLKAVILLRDTARDMIHSPEGKARRGIRNDVTGSGDSLKGIVRSRSVQSIFAQRSRGPNKKMPPVKAIMRWLKRTGQLRSRSSAFLVARAIAKRGTRGQYVMARALEAKRPDVLTLFREMINRALSGR